MSDKVKGYIQELFIDLNKEVSDIVRESSTSTIATQRIMNYVSSRIVEASQGYIADIYSELSKATLREEVFADAANANKFYELSLRKKIYDNYQLDIQSLEAYHTGISYKEINRIYASAGIAVGSATLGGILLGVLSGKKTIPLGVIIAGAFLVGIAAGGYAFAKAIPNKNKKRYSMAVSDFMKNLERELIAWVDNVTEYFEREVQELKKTL